MAQDRDEAQGRSMVPAAPEWDRRSMLASGFYNGVDLAALTDLTPAGDAAFIAILAPCLALVAPVSMDPAAQDAWYEAARMALADVPEDLLRRGAQEAMGLADHPAKVVPAIMKAVRDDMGWRRRYAANAPVVGRAPQPPAIEDNSPMSLDEVKRLPPALRALGRAGGWIRQEDIDEAERLDAGDRSAYVPDEKAA